MCIHFFVNNTPLNESRALKLHYDSLVRFKNRQLMALWS